MRFPHWLKGFKKNQTHVVIDNAEVIADGREEAEKGRRRSQSRVHVTAREAEAVGRLEKALQKRSPGVKITEDRGVWPDHPDELTGLALLMDALGTTDPDFYLGLLRQLRNAGPRGSESNAAQLNFMLSMVIGAKPKDQVEAMLAAQMAAVHVATMAFARRLEDTALLDISERTFNKLARTFVAQVEALKRYRSGGQQTVTVQHVNVSEGGQAIVGNVTQGRRRDAAISDAKTSSDANHGAGPSGQGSDRAAAEEMTK